MSFVFATCEWNRALGFLRSLYPSKVIRDDQLPLLKSLLEEDIVRVQDPAMHQPAQIITGSNYDGELHADSVAEAVDEFMREVHNA